MSSLHAYERAVDPSLYDFMFGNGASSHPWFIDAATGQTYTGIQVKERADALALGMSIHS